MIESVIRRFSRQPSVVVTAAVDATRGDIDASALHRVRQLAEAVRDGDGTVAATVDLYRAAPDAADDGGYLQRLLKTETAFPFGEAWADHRAWSMEKRVFRGADPAPLPAPRGDPAATLGGDPAATLGARLRENQRRFPNALHVVYAHGHRQEAGAVAGMRLERLGDELQRSGDVGLLLLDTCWGSSVDTLSHFPTSVKTVAAAETRLQETVRVHDLVNVVFESQFPLRNVVLRLTQEQGRDARTIGRAVVGEGARQRAPHVIAATDMAAFHGELLPALDAVGRAAQGQPAASEARRAAPVFDAPGQLGDLAGFLRQLGAAPTAAAAHAARAASEALQRTLVARHASGDLDHLGGLSYHQAPSPPLPDGWRGFMR